MQETLKKIQTFFKKMTKKQWIVLIACVIGLTISGTVVYAAYTRVNVVKRVVSTGEGVGNLFASDHMSATVTMLTKKTYTDNTQAPVVTVDVFNYPYPKKSAYRSDATNYTLTATLKKTDGAGNYYDLTSEEKAALSGLDYYVTYKSTTFHFGTGNSVTKVFNNCSIPGGDFNSDSFTVQFDRGELTDAIPRMYCVELTATPEDSDLPTLNGYIMAKYIRSASGGWTGKLERLDANKEYDAYNYVLEGSGSGKITFTWNSNFVTINKNFLQNKNYIFYINGAQVTGSSSLTEADVTTDSNGIKSLTVVVNSAQRGRYEVQFFKVDAKQYDYSNVAVVGYIPDTSAAAWIADE